MTIVAAGTPAIADPPSLPAAFDFASNSQPRPTDADGVGIQPARPRQRVEDAWWTGSIIAASPETLPPGHLYFEPYFYDVIAHGSDTFGSQGYLLYGVAPRLTAGILPSFTAAYDFTGRRNVRMGDLTLDVQYRLTPPNPQKTRPTFALVVQERLPTASFERLKSAGAGSGAGDYATTLGFYGQQYFWLPNGRILRARFNLSHTFESRVGLSDISVYGTPQGFRGEVRPGSSTMADIAGEYSVTSRVVVAMDVLHEWVARTLVVPRQGSTVVSPSERYFALVPAAEYNMSPRAGLILGMRWIPKGRGKTSSWTPVAAYSRFF